MNNTHTQTKDSSEKPEIVLHMTADEARSIIAALKTESARLDRNLDRRRSVSIDDELAPIRLRNMAGRIATALAMTTRVRRV